MPARDIQAWETIPLGPFLGKSFSKDLLTLKVLEKIHIIKRLEAANISLKICASIGFTFGFCISIVASNFTMLLKFL
jgi:hypothetical protein